MAVGTFAAIGWARGYRLNPTDATLEGRGLLVANSLPDGASVFVNNELETATDDTLHLHPGEYQVRIEKDGYSPWEKLLKIETELVTQTNTRLFPSVPNLSALTVHGASRPHASPDGQKIAFAIASSSAELKNGIWVQSLTDNPFFGSNTIQIVADTPAILFSQAQVFWSPNSSQLLIYFSDTQMYLLNASQENNTAQLLNAAFQIESLTADWQRQLFLEKNSRLAKLPQELQQLATQSATLVYFSPDEEKVLYTATQPLTIPPHLLPPLPAINSQSQQRQLLPGHTYIYDAKEDTNYQISPQPLAQVELERLQALYELPAYLWQMVNPSLTATSSATLTADLTSISTIPADDRPILNRLITIQAQYSPVFTHKTFQWFPDSAHVMVTTDTSINIKYYDGTNEVRIYSGGFDDHFAYPWPNGNKLVLLTSLSTDPAVVSNLYALNLE